MKRALALIAVTALPLVAACGGSPHHPEAAPATTVPAAAATSAQPAGCDQATMVMAAVRTQIRNGQDGAAYRQVRDLAKSLPSGQLKLDSDRAALALARFRLDAATGRSVAGDVREAAASLRAITAYCTG